MSELAERPRYSFGGGTVATATELKLADELDAEAWEALGRRLSGIGEASKWWIGDWLAYGKWRYGERYQAVLAALERDYSEVRHLAYVSGSVPPAIREASLSWTHHRLVARLVPKDQQRWLKRAKTEGWSTRELAEELQRALQLSAGEERPELEQLRLTVDPDRRARYDAAAERAGAGGFQEWAIAVLDVEAARSESA